MCSNTHSAGRSDSTARRVSIPRSSIETSSPGWISRRKRRADDVQRAALGGDHVTLAQLPEAQRPHAGGVAEGDHGVLGHDHGRVGALQAAHHLRDGVLDALRRVGGDQRGDDLRVGGRAEPDALGGELVVQLDGIDQVAVVRQRDGAAVVAVDRLRVLPAAGAGRRVAHVADRHVAGERLEAALVEHLGDQPQLALGRDVAALAGRDAGRLLAAVLERVEREVGEPGNVELGGVDTEYPALVAGTVTFAREISGGLPLRGCA